jgi:hypothetical protein
MRIRQPEFRMSFVHLSTKVRGFKSPRGNLCFNELKTTVRLQAVVFENTKYLNTKIFLKPRVSKPLGWDYNF